MLKLIIKMLLGSSASSARYRKTNYRSRRIYVQQNVDVKPYKNKALSDYELRQGIENLPDAQVRNVIDGDTVIVSKGRDNIKIRLDSIDCPEDGQDWGDKAKYGLIKLIGGKRVKLEEHGIDTHGRTLATLYVWHGQKQDWLNVNERMVTLGHAWVMRRFYDHLPRDRQDKLNSLENWSKSKNIGLWSDNEPIAPWAWRNGSN